MTYEVELAELAPQSLAVVTGRVAPAQIPSFLASAFAEVLQVVGAQELAPVGPPCASYEPVGDGFEVIAGLPVSGPVRASGRVTAHQRPGGRAAQILHCGDHAEVSGAYAAGRRWLREFGYVATGRPWESYLDRSDAPCPRTLVFIPCR